MMMNLPPFNPVEVRTIDGMGDGRIFAGLDPASYYRETPKPFFNNHPSTVTSHDGILPPQQAATLVGATSPQGPQGDEFIAKLLRERAELVHQCQVLNDKVNQLSSQSSTPSFPYGSPIPPPFGMFGGVDPFGLPLQANGEFPMGQIHGPPAPPPPPPQDQAAAEAARHAAAAAAASSPGRPSAPEQNGLREPPTSPHSEGISGHAPQQPNMPPPGFGPNMPPQGFGGPQGPRNPNMPPFGFGHPGIGGPGMPPQGGPNMPPQPFGPQGFGPIGQPQGFGQPQGPQGFGQPQGPQGFGPIGQPQGPQGFGPIGQPQGPQGFGPIGQPQQPNQGFGQPGFGGPGMPPQGGPNMPPQPFGQGQGPQQLNRPPQGFGPQGPPQPPMQPGGPAAPQNRPQGPQGLPVQPGAPQPQGFPQQQGAAFGDGSFGLPPLQLPSSSVLPPIFVPESPIYVSQTSPWSPLLMSPSVIAPSVVVW